MRRAGDCPPYKAAAECYPYCNYNKIGVSHYASHPRCHFHQPHAAVASDGHGSVRAGVAVQALCCRPQSRPKAEAWAAQYGIPAVYTDEDACYAAGGFDAVYIGTANHLHYAAAKRALNAGYHVILEKPFVSTAAEARELFALADAKGLVLFEAITIPYMPQFAFLQQARADQRGLGGVLLPQPSVR